MSLEVMGRHAGYIALEVGIASGAEDILIPETTTDMDKIVEELQIAKKRKKSSIIVVAEGDESGGAMEVAKQIEGKTGFDTRVTILGHMQEEDPTSRERLMAARFGYIAVKALLEGKKCGCWYLERRIYLYSFNRCCKKSA
ncbi:6-phosphofructokinase [Brachyspira hyodysenteriae]|nr:6-phosphofructokinase [Brachyspira hyodysenteriae]